MWLKTSDSSSDSDFDFEEFRALFQKPSRKQPIQPDPTPPVPRRSAWSDLSSEISAFAFLAPTPESSDLSFDSETEKEEEEMPLIIEPPPEVVPEVTRPRCRVQALDLEALEEFVAEEEEEAESSGEQHTKKGERVSDVDDDFAQMVKIARDGANFDSTGADALDNIGIETGLRPN
jgi:hypothetical protein